MAPSKRSFKRKDTKTDLRNLPAPPSVFEHPPSSISPPSDLPPPPPSQSQDILSRPPLPETPAKPTLQELKSVTIQDNITSDILNELRREDFGSFLQNIPEERPLTLDEIEGPRFLADKDAYLAAGNKHLELNFYENAATNFACAILSMYLGKDVFSAAHFMSELGSTLPPPIVNSYFFQGTKLLLKGILLKNSTYLVQARQWLLKDKDHLYTEDIDLIRRAILQAETNV